MLTQHIKVDLKAIGSSEVEVELVFAGVIWRGRGRGRIP